MFRKILVATDFGPVSRAALDTAGRLARDQHASLHLITVVRNPSTEPWVVEAVGVDFAAVLQEVRGEAERSLKAASTAYASLPKLVTKVLIGDASDQIVQYAKTTGADLIVLGSHGRHGIKRALLGSVAERVAREADCPVLIVRPVRRARKPSRHAA